MKKEFDLKIDGCTLKSIEVDSLNSLIVATYKRDVAEFKAGDILIDAYDDYKPSAYISIFKEKSKIDDYNFSAFIVFEIYAGKFRHPSKYWDEIKNNRLATEEEKQLLFDALKKQGKRWNAEALEIEELDISEIVVDYETAIKYLGIKDTLLVPLLCSLQSQDRVNKFNTQIKLQVIAEAWNKFDEFEADWGNSDQYKYYPMFKVKDGKFEFSGTSSFRRVLNFHTSSFSFKTEERAKQFAEQFIDLFKVALGI